MQLAAFALRLGDWLGIDLERGGQREVLTRLVEQRAVALGFPTAEAFVATLTDPAHPELQSLIDALTVGHTWFYRDPAQLAMIEAVLREASSGTRPLDIWVPGCATGEDAYVVALIAAAAGREVRVVGSDVDAGAIDAARAGRYGRWSMRELPPTLRGAFRWDGDGGARVEDAAVRRAVAFTRHNLVEPPLEAAGGRGWDLVFCRNVLIYFFPEHAARTVARLAGVLASDGWLVLGGGEIIHSYPDDLELVQRGPRFALRRRSPPSEVRLSARPPSAGARAAPAVLSAAHARLRAGDLAEAEALYRSALAADPDSLVAKLYLGITLHLSGAWSTAAEVLREASRREPTLWPASLFLARCAERLGDWATVRQSYGMALAARDVSPCELGIDPCGDLEEWRDELMAAAAQRLARWRDEE